MKTLVVAVAAAAVAVSLTIATQAAAQDRALIFTPAPVATLGEAVRILDTREGDTLPHRIDDVDPPHWTNLVAVVSVAVIDPAEPGYVTFWDCVGEPPEVAHLNYEAGGITSSMAYAPLGVGGVLCAVSTGGGDLVVDLQAWTAVAGSYPG